MPGQIKYSITTDTLKLTEKDALSFFDVSKDDATTNLFMYQPKHNEIAVVNLSEKKETARIKLNWPKKDSVQTGTLKSFFFHNKDSVFLLYEYRICIIDTSSNIKFEKIINNPESDEWPPVIYTNLRQVFPIYFDSKNKELLVRQNCGDCDVRDSNYYKESVAAFFDFNSGAFNAISISFPDSYKTYFYGDADLPFREVKNDSLIISFSTDPYILILNRSTNQISRIVSKSSFQKSGMEPLDKKYIQDINKRVEHLAVSPLYMKMIYDKYRNVYYRFFLREQKLKNNDGTYNQFGDKELVIMVLDNRFNLMTEINLGKGYLWHYSFVGKDGLYILKDKRVGTTNISDYDMQKFNLILSALLTTNLILLFLSCREENEYDSRVKNILKFLKEDKAINVDSCRSIYLLQANKCNSCNEENINVIFKEVQEKNIKENIIFVLNGFNESVMNTLLEKQMVFKFKIIVDQEGSLDKLGLSFMKNLFISICNRKVIQWKFYG